MAFQVHKAGGVRLFDELGVQFFVVGHERNVHERAILFHDRAAEHLGLVEEIIQDLRFFLVDLLHVLEAADVVFEPFEHQFRHVDAVARRGVEHGVGIHVGLIVEHGRGDVAGVTHEILTDDDHGQTGGRHVLLRTGIQHTEAADVDRLGQDAGRHVRDQRNIARLRQFMINRAVDGVVHADVEIVRIGGEGGRIQLRDVRERLVLGAGHLVCVTVTSGLFERLGRPLTGDDKIRFSAPVHQVERHHGELRGRTALQEQNFVVVRDVHDLAQQRLTFLDDRIVDLGTVRHLHDRLSAAFVIQHFVSGDFQHAFRQHGRTGGEVVYSSHTITSKILCRSAKAWPPSPSIYSDRYLL